MKLITKKTRLVATVAVVCLTLVAGIWIYTSISQNISAGGVAYNPHSPTHTGCSSICYDRKKMGVAWIFYPFDPAYGYDAGPQTIDAPNTPEGKYDVSECIRVGATGYYRSGWIYYYKNNMRPAMVNGVYQYGYFLASEVSFAGGNGIYYDALPGHSLGEIGAEDWGVVRSYFALAEANGATLGHSWPDTSLFCFNPEWTHKPDPISGNGHFESKSKITAIAGGDIPGEIEAETDWDGTGEIRYSTDQSSVNIKFQHSIHYVNESIPTHEDQACCAGNDHNYNDTYASAETKYKVTSMVGGTNSDVGSGDYSSAVNKTTDPTEKYNNTVNVSLAPGETKIVCQAMSYQYKNFTVNGNEHTESGMDGLIPWETKWHSYEDPQGSGQGSSQVCATITRPRESDTGDGTGGTGSTDGDVMYAGEQAQVSWNVNGINTDSRRLLGWEAVVYRIPVGVANSSSLYTGTRGFLYGNQPKDVCSWYGSWDYCSVLSGRSGNFGTGGQSHSYNEAATIVVPDTVGYKYCNSFGYHYQYFWYSSNTGWHGDKTYWRVHDASCRTIAKKPTAAIWNGSLMTNRGVITSSAPRFDNATMGTEASSGGSRTLFGSWTEYLGAIGSNVNGFASGSSFAIGSKDLTAPRSNPLNRNNSSLTIANSDRLGGSGIGNNTTYRTRLTTFLEKQAVRPGGDTLTGMANVSQTQILRYDGNLRITGNITTAPGPYNSIYHVPQVVIFVHGNLEIASDVTRLDAWLIVDGKIDTCSDFVSGSTEADAVGRLRDTCNKQLVLNGPVMAGKLELKRSFGSDPLVTRTGTFGAPPAKWNAGEVFNFNMDSYLWAYAQAGRYDSSYTESYSRELAPRY